ncbi:hypothetical protein [Chryseobacterium sp. S90]|uniref:hypothetical protein n=1 Tax=Chryseobacterium sp. S90 TaxID=3395373 RepID=UPI0039BD531E
MKQQNTGNHDINNKEIIIDDKDKKPLIEVNFQGNIFSNFIDNFRKQFSNAKGLKNLFSRIKKTTEKTTTGPKDIIGPTKTDFNLNELKTLDKNAKQVEKKNKIGLSFSERKNKSQKKNTKFRLS